MTLIQTGNKYLNKFWLKSRPFFVLQQVKKINAVDQKKVGKAGKTTVITHVVTKKKKRVGQLTE